MKKIKKMRQNYYKKISIKIILKKEIRKEILMSESLGKESFEKLKNG